jgi:hypothetical protein
LRLLGDLGARERLGVLGDGGGDPRRDLVLGDALDRGDHHHVELSGRARQHLLGGAEIEQGHAGAARGVG